MSQEIIIGVKKILWWPTDNTGTPIGAGFVQLGKTHKDSASVKEAAPAVFDVMVEESDDPEYQFFTKGKTEIKFSLIDHTPSVLVATKGGTIVGGKWQSPAVVTPMEGMLRIIPQVGPVMQFNRVSLVTVLNEDLKKSAVGLLDITATVLKPIDPTLAPVTTGPYDLPVVNAGVDAAPVVDHYTLQGTVTAGSDAIDFSKWTMVSKPVGAADPVFTTADMPHAIVSGLVNGAYVFKLDAVDVNGIAAVADTVTVTPNIP